MKPILKIIWLLILLLSISEKQYSQTIEEPVNLPISLSYHGSGFKVSEVSSSVGLGWTLNAGGIITRSVRVRPDDYSGLWVFS